MFQQERERERERAIVDVQLYTKQRDRRVRMIETRYPEIETARVDRLVITIEDDCYTSWMKNEKRM